MDLKLQKSILSNLIKSNQQTSNKLLKMVKNENGQCWPQSQLVTNKLIMNKRILINKNVCRSITLVNVEIKKNQTNF